MSEQERKIMLTKRIRSGRSWTYCRYRNERDVTGGWVRAWWSEQVGRLMEANEIETKWRVNEVGRQVQGWKRYIEAE